MSSYNCDICGEPVLRSGLCLTGHKPPNPDPNKCPECSLRFNLMCNCTYRHKTCPNKHEFYTYNGKVCRGNPHNNPQVKEDEYEEDDYVEEIDENGRVVIRLE